MKKSDTEKNFNYLLRLYSQVDIYLSKTNEKQDILPEMVVSFCVVVEKLFKIRLYKENPILVYETSKVREGDILVALIKGKDLDINTISFNETMKRYNLMFQDDFSEEEIQVLIDLYGLRNHFIHGYKSDDSILIDKENIIKKMGTVWEKISTQAVLIFGKDTIKANEPKKKYSEHELEKILEEEVKKKIQSSENGLSSLGTVRFSNYLTSDLVDFNRGPFYSPSSLGFDSEQCPRCKSFSFSFEGINNNVFAVNNFNTIYTDLYKCKKCGLELTRKEYEIAKKLKSK